MRRFVPTLVIVLAALLVAACDLTAVPAAPTPGHPDFHEPTATPTAAVTTPTLAPTIALNQCKKPNSMFGVPADWFRWKLEKTMIFSSSGFQFTISRTGLNVRIDTKVTDPRLEQPAPAGGTLKINQPFNIELSSESVTDRLYVSIWACSVEEVYVFGVDSNGKTVTPRTN